MSSGEFLAWLSGQDDGGRYEPVAGRIVTVNAERVRHAAVKLDVALELRRALAFAGLDCTVFGDGVSVVIDERDTWEHPVRRVLIHHSKAADGTIATRIAREGSLELDPPGVVLDVASCFASLASRG